MAADLHHHGSQPAPIQRPTSISRPTPSVAVRVPTASALAAPKLPGKRASEKAAAGAGEGGERRLADYCTRFRGRAANPTSAQAKRPTNPQRAAELQAKAAKRAKNTPARPGLEIVNGKVVIRPLEIGGGFGENSEEEDEREEVDEETGMTSTYSSFTDRTRTERWGIEETRRFYKGLQQCGTDFTLMLSQFPGRTQRQLKNKFKKETKERAELVDQALNPRLAKPLNVDPYASAFGSDVLRIEDNGPRVSSQKGGEEEEEGEEGEEEEGEGEEGDESGAGKAADAVGLGERTAAAKVFDSTQDSEADLVDV